MEHSSEHPRPYAPGRQSPESSGVLDMTDPHRNQGIPPLLPIPLPLPPALRQGHSDQQKVPESRQNEAQNVSDVQNVSDEGLADSPEKQMAAIDNHSQVSTKVEPGQSEGEDEQVMVKGEEGEEEKPLAKKKKPTGGSGWYKVGPCFEFGAIFLIAAMGNSISPFLKNLYQ